MIAAAMVMSTVNLPVDTFANDFSDGVEISVEDEIAEDAQEVIVDGDEEETTDELNDDTLFEDGEENNSEKFLDKDTEIFSDGEDDLNTDVVESVGQTSSEWVWPTYNHTLKSDWPNYSSGSYHGGTDFPVPLNTEVYSSCDGEVVSVQYLTTSYGRHIKIKAKVNGNVVYIRYCHLNSINVNVGDKVNAGQVIGKSGSTGNSTGPHLHYEVRNSEDRYNPSLNPRLYLPGSSYYYEKNDSPDPTPTPIPIPQGSQTISDGEYHIVSGLDSSKALDVYGASKDNAANIQIYSNLSDGRETFHVTYLGNGAYKIINSNSGRCLDVDGAGMTAGTNVQQYDYVGADQQQWIIQEDNGWFNIISKKNGLYLDVEDGNSSNGANAQVWNGNGSDAQRWRFVAWGDNVGETVSEGRYHIVSAVDEAKKGLDVYCGVKDSGANIRIYDNLNDDSQTFDLTYLGRGYYKIVNTNSGKSLDVQNADTKKGSNIQQYDYVGANQQQWIIKESSGGWFNIISKHNGLCLDVAGGAAENGRNVQGWICNGSDAQKWRFVACGSNDGRTISDDEYHIVSVLDEKQGLDVENCSKNDGANIQIYLNTWDARETFHVNYLGDGYYKITNSYSGKSLDVAGADTRCGTNLQQYGYNGVNQQQWILRKTSDGYYKIISKASGLCVDVENGVAANNANVWMWTSNETKAQKWKFIPVKKDLSGYSLSLSQDTYSYDGKEKTPDVTVKNGTVTLVKDSDYSVSYTNNTNAGTATVTITGTGKYTGKITRQFKINKASQNLTVSIDKTDLAIGETAQIKASGQGQITYKSSAEDKVTVSSTGLITGKQAGDATITITAAGTENYNSATKELTIHVLKDCVGNKHTWDSGKITKQPSCTEDGKKTYTCTTCGTTKTENLSSTGHAWDNGKITREATCTTDGQRTYTCATCKNTKTESISKTGHKEVKDVAVSATCENTGKTEGSHCSVCGTVIKKQETIPAAGHTWDSGKVTKQATCTTDGQKTYTCTICKKTKTENISKTGHKEVKDAAVSATCENTGKTEGSHCSVCNTVIKKQEILPATGHTWDSGKVTKAATCTTDGEKTYTCTTCHKTRIESVPKTGHTEVKDAVTPATCENAGKTEGSHCSICGTVLKKQETLPVLGHTWDSGKVTKAATCTTDGEKIYTCTTCHKTRIESVPKTGHTEVKDAATPATCENTGKTEGSHCSICGTVIKQQETLPATGHTWDNGKSTKQASCTENGEKVYTCTTCQKTRTETIPATGHTEITKFAKKATCETEGYTGDIYCNNCGEMLKEGKVIEKLSHDWKQTGTKKATCTASGENTYTCTHCNKTKTEQVPATGHKWSTWKKISDATVLKPQKQQRTCSLCHTSQTREYGSKLKSVMRTSCSSILLKTKQTTNALTVSGMAKGDYVSRVISGNTRIVRVTRYTKDGKIQLTAQGRTGNTNVTIRLAGGAVKRINVKVQSGAVKTTAIRVSFTKATLKAGTKKTISTTVTPSTSQEKVTYTTSNKNIATVTANGIITARKRGTAKITVKSGNKKQLITITVK